MAWRDPTPRRSTVDCERSSLKTIVLNHLARSEIFQAPPINQRDRLVDELPVPW